MELTSLERLPLWIGGRAVAPSTTRYGEVTNPATGEVIRHVPLANAADVDAAVRSAAAALPAWRSAPSSTSFAQRSAWCRATCSSMEPVRGS